MMIRLLLISVFVTAITQPALAVIESAVLRSTITSDPADGPASECVRSVIITDGSPLITDLDDCGSLGTGGPGGDPSNFRLQDNIYSSPRAASVLFTRRAPLPLGGLGRRIDGTGTLSQVRLFPINESPEVAMSMSFVERLPARVSETPATLSLSVRGDNLSDFSFADIKVFDHDTDELLISWNLDDLPIEPNNGIWYQQEISFADRMGHAIRYEYESVGQATTGASLLAATYLNLPEPHGVILLMPGILLLGLLRKRRTVA